MQAKGREKTMDTKDQLLRAEQVAEMLNVSVSVVYQWAHRGLLPCVKLSRSVRFRRDSIDKMLDQREKVAFGKVA